MLNLLLSALIHQAVNAAAPHSSAPASPTRVETKLDLPNNRYMKVDRYSDFQRGVARIARSLACDGDDNLIAGGCKTNAAITFQNGAEVSNSINLVWTCDVAQMRAPKPQEPSLELEVSVLCERNAGTR